MTPANWEAFNQLVVALYRGPLETDHWQGFLQQLRLLFDAKLAVLNLSRPKPEDPGVTFVDGMELTRESGLRYANEFSALDPFVNLPDGAATTMEEVIPLDQLKQTAYYQQFMAPADLVHTLGVDIYAEGVVRIYLRVVRGEKDAPFGADEKYLFHLLVPHLRQLLQWLDRDQQRETERALYENVASRLAMGTVLLDKQRRIIHANPIARHLLDSREGLRESNGRLVADSPSDNRRLQRVFKEITKQQGSTPAFAEAITLSQSHSPRALYLLIKPVTSPDTETTNAIDLGDDANPPKAVVFINAPDTLDATHQDILQQLFDFTRSEARLAIALANGLSLDEIAEELCVTRNTVRTHLRGAFQKADVNQQSALVSLVLRSIAGLG